MRGRTYYCRVDDRESSMADSLKLAAFGFKVDRVTAEVTTALTDGSMPSILLKGPGIANWLYSVDRPRLYVDSDLLIRKEDWANALSLVKALGFEDDLGPLDHPRMESGAGYPWVRDSDGASVDLHYTLFGIGVAPEAVWEVFSEGVVREQIGGVEVALPSHAARLLHISLHAVQHGGETWDKPMSDLELAIAKAPERTWVETRELAARLEAAEIFATGLRLLPQGHELATAIGTEEGKALGATLRLESVPTAEGFQELSEAPGLRGKLALVFRELFPSRTFMRWWSPIARRGRIGLALTYFWRPIWLLYRSAPGFLAWRRAGRSGR